MSPEVNLWCSCKRGLFMLIVSCVSEVWHSFIRHFIKSTATNCRVQFLQFLGIYKQKVFDKQEMFLSNAFDFENFSSYFSLFDAATSTYDFPTIEDTSFQFGEDDVDKKMIPDQMLLSPPATPYFGPPGHHDSTNKCPQKSNKTFIWCFPSDYNQEKHPFTCKILKLRFCLTLEHCRLSPC